MGCRKYLCQCPLPPESPSPRVYHPTPLAHRHPTHHILSASHHILFHSSLSPAPLPHPTLSGTGVQVHSSHTCCVWMGADPWLRACMPVGVCFLHPGFESRPSVCTTNTQCSRWSCGPEPDPMRLVKDRNDRERSLEAPLLLDFGELICIDLCWLLSHRDI